MNENDLIREQNKGAKANTILEDELFIESFTMLKAAYEKEMVQTSYKDSEARTAIWVAWHQLDKVKSHLTEIMNTGKLASKQLQDLKKP
jgi:hypothetical protein|tara:strand:+ start:1212 stop:1478 length:267 start_codon:yes stop_codon:yes gene_type:complete